jgi:hypothetical protein
MKADRLVLGGLVLFYALLGLVFLQPEAVYSGDIGVKYVQARAVAANGYRSLALNYPGAVIDSAGEFAPLRPPFVMNAGNETQAIFSPTFALVQGAAVSMAGISGLTIVSVLAGALVLLAVRRLVPAPRRVEVLIAVGVGGPLWFYAASGWEHAPAVALGTAAFAVALVPPAFRPEVSRVIPAALLAGLLLGGAGIIRDEVLLLAPGLMIAIAQRTRRVRDVALIAAGAGLALAAAAGLDVWIFDRPAAAHLRHAVHMVQAAGTATSVFDPTVPVLVPFTLRERYETVIQYWLLGYGHNPMIVAFSAGLAAALLVRWRMRSSIGLLIWMAAVVGLCAGDFYELLTAPKWLAGLHRVAPYLVFALLPAAAGRAAPRLLPPAAVLWTTVLYVGIAFATVDTTGGKSLGPRLLLPLFPLLAVVAVARIRDYVESPDAVNRCVGAGGVLLVAMTIVMHLFGTVPAYYHRNLDDASTIAAVARATERVIVCDNQFTAQLLLPLYHRKLVMVADTAGGGERLGELLAQQRIGAVLLVTRVAETSIALPPFVKRRSETVGRMTLQYWHR